jgi:hypothetical protein
MVPDTYHKVGKYARYKLVHYKKFVNDKLDLNDIMLDGSLGKKMMEHFKIIESHSWVVWWNSHLQEGNGRWNNQSKERVPCHQISKEN